MKDLLNFVVEAHGGLRRWNKVEAVTVAASVTGEIWKVKSKPDYLKNVIFEVETYNRTVTAPDEDGNVDLATGTKRVYNERYRFTDLLAVNFWHIVQGKVTNIRLD